MRIVAFDRFINCGTVMAVAGFLVFALLGYVVVQFLCYGMGGAAGGSMRFPG